MIKTIPSKVSKYLLPIHTSKARVVPQEDSDDDEEAPSGGFFSFGNDPVEASVSRHTVPSASVGQSQLTNPLRPYSQSTSSTINQQDTPLQFKQNTETDGFMPYGMETGPPAGPSCMPPTAGSSQEYDTQYGYSEPYSEEVGKIGIPVFGISDNNLIFLF